MLLHALAAATGRLIESRLEIVGACAAIRRAAALSDRSKPGPQPSVTPGVLLEGVLVPYPLVGVIAPWNAPLLLALIDAVQALAVGCAVLLKPSEITAALSPILRASMEADAVLAGVFAVVDGGPEIGAELIEHVDAVCFTGSVASGRAVAQAAAKRLIPAFLELGGKDPAIVLPGADLDHAATALLWGSITNAGQACQSIERIYIARADHDRFIERIVEAARVVRLSCEVPSGLAPFIAERQVALVRTHIADALARGASIACGGEWVEAERTWLRPTVLTGVDHSMLVMTEETFGPVLPVMAYDSVEEAVRLANDSIYGLSAAVFGAPDEARAVALRLNAGAISVNDAALTAIVPDAAKDPFGQSGLGGPRAGPDGPKRFLRRRCLIHAGPGAPLLSRREP